MKLSLREADILIVADSYYFLIERNFMPKIKSFEKICLLLKELLYKWYLAVDKLTLENTAYLPFGFYDEFVSGIAVTEREDSLTIRYYATKTPNGWITSDFRVMLKEQIVDWIGEKDWYTTQDEFVGEIHFNIDRIKAVKN